MSLILQTYTGRFDYEALADGRPVTISLRDMAHSLAGQPRFLAHGDSQISIAEHSINVKNLAKAIAVSRNLSASDVLHAERWGFLHDGHETYFADLPSPLKRLFRQRGFTLYDELRAECDRRISEHFELPLPVPDIVHEADHQMLLVESRQAFERLDPVAWGDGKHVPAAPRWPGTKDPIQMKWLTPKQAELAFLAAAIGLGLRAD